MALSGQAQLAALNRVRGILGRVRGVLKALGEGAEASSLKHELDELEVTVIEAAERAQQALLKAALPAESKPEMFRLELVGHARIKKRRRKRHELVARNSTLDRNECSAPRGEPLSSLDHGGGEQSEPDRVLH